MKLISSKNKLKLRELLSLAAKKTGQIDRKAASAEQSWRILMYHRIADPKKLPYMIEAGMYVRPETFDMQMRVLSEGYNLISLDKLIERVLKGEEIEAKTVAITFDDGWEDNYSCAFPILSHYKIPATVFLATKYMESDELFWTDQIGIALLRQDSDIYAVLKQVGVKNLSSIESVISELKQKSTSDRKKAVAQLTKNLPKIKPQFLSWAEIKEMDEAGIVFGCHSHSHEFITSLSEEEKLSDLSKNIEVIQKAGLENCSQAFCYPGGRYSKVTQRAVSKQNFSASLATHKGSFLEEKPPIFGRVGIHQDISSTPHMFEARLWL